MNDSLKPPPHIQLSIISEEKPTQPFSQLRHFQLRNHYPDGSQSKVYTYDAVDRQNIDAVAIVLHSQNAKAEPCLCLRSSLRPPLLVRRDHDLAYPETNDDTSSLWEVPAGLIEHDEKGLQGLRRCASRETLEEVGLDIPPDRFSLLGPSAFPSPGVVGEKMFWLHAFVLGCPVGTPQGDGSPVEDGAEIKWVSLSEAKRALDDGLLGDLKTEIALRRLIEHLSFCF